MLQRIEAEKGVPVRGEGIYFRMREGGRIVRFFAATPLLEAMAHRAGVDERETFLAFRRELETLAAERYQQSPFRDDSIIEMNEALIPFASRRMMEHEPQRIAC